jgi:hypothetical protein
LIEHWMPHGSGPPPHVHPHEDEAFWVMEGEMTAEVGGKALVLVLVLGPGSLGHVPRNTVHSFKVTSKVVFRKRFGIETSYRRRREARIRTCTRDPKLRLFYVGIGLLLRNVWVLLHAMLFAKGSDIHPEPCLEKLRFADMLEWMADFIKSALEAATAFRIDCNTGKRLTAGETA